MNEQVNEHLDDQPVATAPWLQPLSEEPAATAAPGTPSAGDVPQWGLAPSGERRSRNTAKLAGPTGTLSAWIIALSPAIAAVALGYVLLTFGFDLGTGFPQIAVAAPYLLVLLFAALDRSQLLRSGYEAPAAWTWAALTAPVYLLVRASALGREGGNGRAPFVAWIVFFVLAIAGFVGYGFLTGQPLVPGLPG